MGIKVIKSVLQIPLPIYVRMPSVTHKWDSSRAPQHCARPPLSRLSRPSSPPPTPSSWPRRSSSSPHQLRRRAQAQAQRRRVRFCRGRPLRWVRTTSRTRPCGFASTTAPFAGSTPPRGLEARAGEGAYEAAGAAPELHHQPNASRAAGAAPVWIDRETIDLCVPADLCIPLHPRRACVGAVQGSAGAEVSKDGGRGRRGGGASREGEEMGRWIG
jgi:hypothetical protein